MLDCSRRGSPGNQYLEYLKLIIVSRSALASDIVIAVALSNHDFLWRIKKYIVRLV